MLTKKTKIGAAALISCVYVGDVTHCCDRGVFIENPPGCDELFVHETFKVSPSMLVDCDWGVFIENPPGCDESFIRKTFEVSPMLADRFSGVSVPMLAGRFPRVSVPTKEPLVDVVAWLNDTEREVGIFVACLNSQRIGATGAEGALNQVCDTIVQFFGIHVSLNSFYEEFGKFFVTLGELVKNYQKNRPVVPEMIMSRFCSFPSDVPIPIWVALNIDCNSPGGKKTKGGDNVISFRLKWEMPALGISVSLISWFWATHIYIVIREDGSLRRVSPLHSNKKVEPVDSRTIPEGFWKRVSEIAD
ncbi:MAG: hypothetical protein LBJ71_04755 [Holosporaceae bacterium]|jgi:hypothetical protein|nr:hypothetical protein [Holosporaceae bacterium]